MNHTCLKRSPADQLKIKYLNWEWSCSPERQSWPSMFSKEITCYSKGDNSHWRVLTKPSKSWTVKKAECQRINAFKLWCWRKVLSPLDCKKIKPVIPTGNQPWIFIGRTADEAETPILCLPDAKSWLIWKDPDAGKDWGQEEKGTTENKMVGWHHRLNGHGFG